MEDFKSEGIRIQNQTIEQISEEYRDLLISYQRKKFNQINEIVTYEIRGVPETRIEEWIDDYLIGDIKSFGNRNIDRLSMSIDDNFQALLRNIKFNQETEKSFKQYLEDLKNIVKKENLTDLNGISDIFRKKFLRKIENYYEAFYGISDRNFNRTKENIDKNLKIYLRKLNQQFIEEYQEIVKKSIIKNAKKTKENIDELQQQDKLQQQEKLSEEQIVRISKIVEYNNYELIRENDKLYIYNPETKEPTELLYDKQNEIFYTKDRKIGIKITDKYIFSIDIKKNTTILDDGISLEIASIDRKNIVKISQGIVGYDFYINNKQVLTTQEILSVIEIIKQTSPVYYNKLLKSQEFIEIIESMKKNQKTNISQTSTTPSEPSQMITQITENNEENIAPKKR